MAKNFKKNAGKNGKRVNNKRNQAREEAKLMLGKGEVFGDAIIWNMSLFALDAKGMGIATIGLAKALAALKNVAEIAGVEIGDLFGSELAHFEGVYDELTEEEAN
jgi:hypothetical protein